MLLRHSLLVLLAAAGPLAGSLSAQGSLTPSGAPAAGMKRLDQVEPRIDLATLPSDASAQIVISAPGTYFLSGNLTGVASKHGIRVDTSDVTIDLRGHSLRGISTSLDGINANAATRVTILNGNLTGWRVGVQLVSHSVVDQVNASSNRQQGFKGGAVNTLRNCTAAGNTSHGFDFQNVTSLTDCVGDSNGGVAFGFGDTSIANRCLSRGNTAGGFYSIPGALTATQCSSSNDNYGFAVGDASILRDCSVRAPILYGYTGGSSCSFTNCSAIGIVGSTFGVNAVDGCNLSNCSISNFTTGIQLGTTANLQNSNVRNCTNRGIFTGPGATIHHCAVRDCNFEGIATGGGSSIVATVARGGTGVGISGSIGSVIDGCAAQNAGSHGIKSDHSTRIVNSSATGSGGSGFFTEYNCLISDSISQLSANYGIRVGPGTMVNANVVANNTQSGIILTGRCRAERNHVSFNGSYGLDSINDPARPDFTGGNYSYSNAGTPTGTATANYNPFVNNYVGVLKFPNESTVTATSNF